ncbi:ABC transporter ATP-binding protein [Desulfopila sp. IMCC35006]|uniref:ABC transporter ATP-binding protein n=1 Tax=Desulfopila sp. IMCC35006 TaxID=2569542 RepID=UPI00142EC1E0|nr:ABC transporter ATP-binding protein [Desulfopila sp. IMCC35006]
MSSDIAIRVVSICKRYEIYNTPRDRLKQFFLPSMQRLTGRHPLQYFKEFWALRDVSFEVKKGETIGIVGRNGSGKSTLLQVICGTLFPTSGSVETDGRIAALLELGSGFNPEFTGRENVYLNGAVLGLGNKEIDMRFDEIVAFADIGDFIEQPVKTYSSGMYVRLAFAIQANVDPEILIVDEALAVGDPAFVHRCMDRIHTLQAGGTTILLVTHDSLAVKRFCSKAYWLDRGTLRLSGESNDVVDAYLHELFDNVSSTVKTVTAESNWNYSENGEFIWETTIPNQDRRLGDLTAKVIGLAIYDINGQKISATQSNEKVLLRFSVINVSIPVGTELSFGYIFRNFRGEEIAATNTNLEECVPVRVSSLKEVFNIAVEIFLPSLHSGSYSISVGVSHCLNRKIKLADRIVNGLFINVVNPKQITTITSFDSKFEIKPLCL